MKLKIISDGTNVGTKLIDEDTGEMIHGISKLTWEANVKEIVSKVNVEFFNIPVEIVSKAEVNLLEWDSETGELPHTKTFDKNVRVVNKLKENMLSTLVYDVIIYDSDTNEKIGAIQEIKWEATPEGSKAKIKKIKFDNKDW